MSDDSEWVSGVVGVVALVCIVLLGLGVVWFLLQLLVICSLPIAGGAAVFSWVFYRLPRFRPVEKSEDVALAIYLDSSDLLWKYDAAHIGTALDPRPLALTGCYAGAIVCIGLLVACYALGWLSNLHWWTPWLFGRGRIPSGVSLAFGILVSLGVGGAVAYALIRRRPPSGAEDRVAQATAGMNGQGVLVSEVLDLVREMEDQAQALGLQGFDTRVQELAVVATRRKLEILANPAKFGSLLQTMHVELRGDLLGLQRASELRLRAREAIVATTTAVRRTGSKPLLLELEQACEGLESEELRQLLVSRQWAAHSRVLESMIAELGSLAASAEDYVQHVGDWEQAAAEKQRSGDLTDAEACEILGVPAAATNEEIREMYRRLARLWHPDVRKEDTTIKMQQINAAYQRLCETRGIR